MYSDPNLVKAMNEALRPGHLDVALCFQLPEDGTVPEWLELVPAGEIQGRDGRHWLNDRPEDVVAAFNEGGKALPVDWCHAIEKTPPGEPVPKSAWIEEMEVRDGKIFGRFAWTERGLNSVQSKDYRYISPVFMFRRDNYRVMKITSAALTDDPNLHLKAINSFQEEEQQMHPLLKAIRKELGLGEDATEAQALNAIQELNTNLEKAQNSQQQPSLDKYVPRADYDGAVARAQNAEQQLQGVRQEQLDKEIDAEIQSALDAGKITPATTDYHKAQCAQEGGLERFREFVKNAPEVAGATGLDKKKADGQGKALNDEDKIVASMFGNSVEDIEKYGADA